MAIDYEDYKEKSEQVVERIKVRMDEAIDAGIAAVGMKKAFSAALATQHSNCADFFTVVHDAYHGCVKRGIDTPMLPLTPEVLAAFNNATGSLSMVAEFMRRDALDIISEDED